MQRTQMRMPSPHKLTMPLILSIFLIFYWSICMICPDELANTLDAKRKIINPNNQRERETVWGEKEKGVLAY